MTIANHRWQIATAPCCLAVVLLAAAAAAGTARAKGALPAPHVYLEAEEFFSLQPARRRLRGFFGTGYRALNEDGAPPVIDKTVFLFRTPREQEGYTLWVRAYADGKVDRRVAAEWISAGEATRLKPTHATATPAGFRWECAGTLKPFQGRGRQFYQLRLHAVGDSRPVVDAVLLTVDPKCMPKEAVRPCDDKALTGGDGEGSTRINHSRLVADSTVRLRAVYSVGPSGIAEGGALRFFVPEAWSPPQAKAAGKPGHVAAAASREGVGLAVECHPPGRGAYAFSHELRHHHECFVRLTAGSLRKGDTVTVTYAGTVQPFTQSAEDFRNEARAWYSPALPLGIWTDANADGVFWPVPPDRSHRLEVVAAEAAALHVVVPSVVQAGERFAIQVAALDRFRNPAPTYRGTLAFSVIDLKSGKEAGGELPPPTALGPKDSGWRHLPKAARLAKAGAYALRVRDAAHKLEGLSNPVRCVTGEPAYRVFWGDLHNHHRRCDGLRRFAEAAAHARDIAGCDVVALSPHACYITDGDLADLWRVDERFHEPGRFVPLFAYEWAAGGRGAAHSVIYSEQPMPLCFRAWGGGNVVRGRPALYKLLDRHKLGVIEVPHHVRSVCDRHPRYQKAIEIYSQWGEHDRGVEANLDDGLRACFFGASDNHTGQPGLQSKSNRWAIHHHYGGLTAFLAPGLSRRELFAAIEARRCYATTGCRIVADFKVNGTPMGGEVRLPSPREPRVIELDAIASRPIQSITLIRNGMAIRAWRPVACVVRLAHTNATPYGGPTDYYYVRIECDDQTKAWLTPVWVSYAKAIAAPGVRERQQADKQLRKMKNLARAKPVTVSFPDGITAGKPSLVTDGKLDAHLGHGTPGRAWAQVDLSAVHEIGALRVWHYYRDGRAYYGNRIEVSATGEFAGEQTLLFDSDKEGAYRETPRGRIFVFPPLRARYVRNRLNGNSSNLSSQWIEIQAFGPVRRPKVGE